jgi:hypothetical protein
LIRTRTLPRLLTLGAAVVVVAAACGPGGSPTPGGTTPAGTTPAATTPAGSEPAGTAAAGGYEEFVPDPALLTAAEGEGGTVTTIALPHSWCNYGEVIETFKTRTGLDVNELNPGAGRHRRRPVLRPRRQDPGPDPAVQGRDVGHDPRLGQGR